MTSGEDFRHTNASRHENDWDDEFPLWLLILSTVYFILVIVFGTVGNGLLLLIFATTRTLWKNSLNVLIFSSTFVNFVISVFIDPICASGRLLVGSDVYHVVLDCTEFFLLVCAVSSLYTLTAIAANRYLLIAYPNTTYRTCCVRRRSMIALIVVIWIFTFPVVYLLWVAYEFTQEDEVLVYSPAFLIFLSIACFLNYLPLTAIPCFHILTLRVIRASRNRVEATGIAKVPQASDGIGPVKHSMGTASTLEQTNGAVGHSGMSNGRRIKINYSALKSSLKSPHNLEVPTISTTLQIAPGTKHVESQVASLRTAQSKLQRKSGNRETMMIRMMIAMYVVLFVAWFPSLVGLLIVTKWERIGDYLYPFGFFIPMYPTLLPYVIIWTNKHFRTVVQKRFRLSIVKY